MVYRIILKKIEAKYVDFVLVGEWDFNRIRRHLMDDISTYAIDTVSFRQNTSVFDDDTISHRLQLIPVVESINNEDFRASFDVHVANSGDSVLGVYSQDVWKSLARDVLVAKLRPGEVLSFTVHVRIGTQKEHAKFQHVTQPTYQLADDGNSCRISYEVIAYKRASTVLQEAILYSGVPKSVVELVNESK